MSKTSEALSKYLDVKADATMNLEVWDWRTRPGVEARKGRAAQALPSYRKAYHDALREGMYRILVVGPAEKAEKFLSVVEEEDSSLVVENANHLYESIGAEVEPTLGHSRIWGMSQYNRLLAELRDIMEAYGIDEMNMPQSFASSAIPTLEDVVATIKDSIRGSSGASLTEAYIEKVAFDEAEAVKYDFPILSVVVFGIDGVEANLIQDKNPDNVFVVDLNKEAPTKATLVKTYKAIKSKHPVADSVANGDAEKTEKNEEK